MKYLIVKGWLGFGDRLESLKMAVAYALSYNLQIYVDWKDPMWSHGAEDFYTYFNLVNMPVLKSLDDIPADASVYPPFWKDNLKTPISTDLLTNYKGDVPLDLGYLKMSAYDADVVVCSCIGPRTLFTDSTFFANVFRVVDPRITGKVRHHLSAYPVRSSWGVHIRGTDRLRDNRRMLSVQSIVSNITVSGGMNRTHFVAVSDDKENTDLWLRYYPRTYVVSELALKQTSHAGNHNLQIGDLSVSKDLLNVDMLIDFFVLAACERIFTTVKDSRFAQEARRLHPHVGTIVNGA